MATTRHEIQSALRDYLLAPPRATASPLERDPFDEFRQRFAPLHAGVIIGLLIISVGLQIKEWI